MFLAQLPSYYYYIIMCSKTYFKLYDKRLLCHDNLNTTAALLVHYVGMNQYSKSFKKFYVIYSSFHFQNVFVRIDFSWTDLEQFNISIL